ncbi:MAG: hypothetical protein M1510_12290 [Nitrospirae bacterium]|nr:hypothetical protein [Nitrospirota bacterium]
MTGQQLKEYCDAEFENIDAVIAELFSVVKTEVAGYSVPELAAIATFIHNFYNGIENILKRTLAFKQIGVKDSSTWHKDLLKASADMGAISNDLYDTLLIYLSFRHFFVHAYSFTLQWEEIKPLAEDIQGTLGKFKSAIYDYINKLDQIS